MPAVPGELTEFACPRCGNAVSERFYGPCQACRGQLQAAMSSSATEAGEAPASSRFEPAMHVVPNHVATKD
jgi:hypothetical protein